MTTDKNATYTGLCLELTGLLTYSDGVPDDVESGGIGESSQVAIGVVICFITSLMQAMGMTMQKVAHKKQQEEQARLDQLGGQSAAVGLGDNVVDGPKATPVYKMWVWHVGLWLYLASQLGGQPLALVYLPPSIVAPLGSITLGFNALFAWLMLGERFMALDLVGTLVAAGGAVIIAYFGYAPQGTFAIDELIQLFASTEMIVYMCFMVTYAVLAVAFGRYLDWNMLHPDQRMAYFESFSTAKLKSWKALVHATLSGALGAGVLLLGKAGVEIALTSFTLGDNQFDDVGTYFILFSLAVVGVLQMVFLNSALALGEQSIVVPVFFCVFTVLSMVETMVYFDQWICFDAVSSVLIVLGILVIFGGVWLLSRKEKTQHTSMYSRIDDEHQALLAPINRDPQSKQREDE